MSKYSCNENGLFLEDEMYLTNDDVFNILNNQDNKITELESKLAEKEEAIKYLNGIKRYDIGELLNENIKLNHQLEEKDKEIKQLKLDLGMFKSVNEFINHYGIDKAREVLLQSEKTKKQDKISFAVEQIVKTKETLIKFLQDNGFYENEWYDLFDEIDNQINQLKEGS